MTVTLKKFKAEFLKKIVIVAFLGAGLYLILFAFSNFHKLIQSFYHFKYRMFVAALLLSLLNYVIRFIKWHYYLKILHINIEFKDSLIIFFAGLTMTISPAKFGEVLKSLLLKLKYNYSISKSVPVVLAERITDFLALVLLCLIGVLYKSHNLVFPISAGIILLLVIVALSFKKPVDIFCSFIPERFRNFAVKIKNAHKSMRELIRPAPLFITVIISVFSWFCECIAFFLIIQGMGVEFALIKATFIYSVATILGAISMIPGGLVAVEGSLAGFLIYYGLSKPVSASITFIIRLATLWFGVVFWLIFLFIFMAKLKTNGELKQNEC